MVLRWIIILEDYGMWIECILCKKNTVTDAPSLLPNNGNQKTTQESHYLTETISEIYYIKEVYEGVFPISF